MKWGTCIHTPQLRTSKEPNVKMYDTYSQKYHQFYITKIWHTTLNTITPCEIYWMQDTHYCRDTLAHVRTHLQKWVVRFAQAFIKESLSCNFSWVTKRDLSIAFSVICHHRHTNELGWKRILFKWCLFNST